MEYSYKWIIDFEDFCTFSVLYILKEHILQHLEEKSKCHFFFSTGIMVLIPFCSPVWIFSCL